MWELVVMMMVRWLFLWGVIRVRFGVGMVAWVALLGFEA
jgi:hypothetical protein